MKKLYLILLSAICMSINTYSQDAYHSTLQTDLQNNFAAPTAQWIFFDTEESILNDAYNWGMVRTVSDSEGTAFSRKVEMRVNNAGGSPWDAGWGILNNVSLQTNDVVLCVFSLRSLDGVGKVNFFVENADNFTKEVILTFPVGTEWQTYYIPFKLGDNYSTSKLSFGFHLAHQVQRIELGGFTALNYDTNVDVANLPNEINNDKYDGHELDAPWRAAAAQRIDELRKANLNISVKNTSGEAIENAGVNIKMLKHEFAFGSAINANKIAGNNAQNNFYQNKITNLDGQGHGFNWVVFENDMKWPAWEDNWFVSNEELIDAVQWLRERDIEIRGHTLVWPGFDNLPNDINNNTPIASIKNRIFNHLDDIINRPGMQGEIAEWDVLNEIVTNTSLQNRFSGEPGYTTGRELYVEIFNKARELDANTGLWLNDYITISNGVTSGGNYDLLKQYAGELVDAGVDLEGIGFQSHIGGFPNGIPSVLATLDDFYNSFGTKAKVTEFDMPDIVNDELAAKYLRDYLTAIFSHPSMDGFMFWSFWDGATYMNPAANLFDMNWGRTPAGDAFVDLVFNEWWTDETQASSADGMIDSRVFKGQYEISYECDGILIKDTVNMTADFSMDIVCDNIATNTFDLSQNEIKVFPNPASNELTINLANHSSTTVRLFDSSGKQVLDQTSDSDTIVLDVSPHKGLFMLLIESEGKQHFEKIIIQ